MKLRFTIRDLFWLTALISLASGWWLDHRIWKRGYDDAAAHASNGDRQIKILNGRVELLEERKPSFFKLTPAIPPELPQNSIPHYAPGI
jgi:hypothetical protein